MATPNRTVGANAVEADAYILLLRVGDGIMLTDRTWAPLGRMLRRALPEGETVWSGPYAAAQAERARWPAKVVVIVPVTRPFMWAEA